MKYPKIPERVAKTIQNAIITIRYLAKGNARRKRGRKEDGDESDGGLTRISPKSGGRYGRRVRIIWLDS